MENVLLDKEELVKYIICKYKKANLGKEISPIKLQKSLYFLFAMWGGKVLAAKNENVDDDNCGKFNPYLFAANFEAWKYGPVDSQIGQRYKDGQYDIPCVDCDNIKLEFHTSDEFEKTTAKEYIDQLLDRIFITSDFGLVDFSHEDKCWKNAIESIDKKIDSEEIIKEYALR